MIDLDEQASLLEDLQARLTARGCEAELTTTWEGSALALQVWHAERPGVSGFVTAVGVDLACARYKWWSYHAGEQDLSRCRDLDGAIAAIEHHLTSVSLVGCRA